MKTLVYGLLALSLAANAALLWITRAPTPAAAAVAATPPVLATAAPSTPSAPAAPAVEAAPGEPAAKPVVWRGGSGDDALRAMADDLRAAGFPSRAIYAAVSAAFREKLSAGDPVLQGPFWQRYSAETQRAVSAYYRDGQKRLDDILGPDGKLSAQLDPVERKRRYGNLSDAKLDAIKLVERDYAEMRQDATQTLMSRTPTATDFTALRAQEEVLKKEIAADLASTLTPAELAEYQMRNSDVARQLSSAVQEVPLNEAEFAALYQAKSAFEQANQLVPGVMVSGDQYLARTTQQQAMYEQARALLGDERFYGYLSGSDSSYREMTRLAAQYPSVTPAAAYQVVQLRAEAMQLQSKMMNRGAPVDPAEITANYAAINTRLEALVGADAAAAIRKQPGNSALRAPVITQTPRPAQAPRN